MSELAFDKVLKFVSKEAFTWIIKDSLSAQDITSVLARCGINYRGMRTQSLPPEVLAKDITGEVYKNPKARQLIEIYLNQANREQIDEITAKTRDELLAEITGKSGKMLKTGNVGKYLWAIIADTRPDTTSLIPIFIGKVITTVKQFSEILKNLEKTTKNRTESDVLRRPHRPLDPIKENLKKKIKEKESAFNDLQVTTNKLEERVKLLDDKYTHLNKTYKETLSENQQLKHSYNQLEKENDKTKKELLSLNKERTNITEMQNTIHHLERENKKLHYDLEKSISVVEKSDSINDEKIHLQKIIETLNSRIETLQSQLKSREKTLQKLISEKEKKTEEKKKALKKTQQRKIPFVGVFVDVQNIYYAAREKYNAKLDYHKLLTEMLRGRNLYKALAYVVKTPEINQDNFIDALTSMGFDVKSRDLKIRHDGSMKGDWDLGIAIDMMLMSDKLDAVVLVSGDGDFVDLVKMLKTRSIRVEVISFPHNTSQELIDNADYYHAIDERLLIKY